MKKILLAGVIAACSASAYAVPDTWSMGAAQGFTEYSISNGAGNAVIIACNEGAGEGYDNSVSVYSNDRSLDGDISFLIDDEAYYIPENTTTRSGANAWVSFTSAITRASEFEVYVNNKPAGKFKPRAKNSQKIFSDFECAPVE
ncbi:hypothetical protein ACWQEN_002263 [Morganella morganii]|uniref:hypothetical protein n=1 Tax=Morganella morganii TaxID=582 RepID=UPI001E2B7D46|nr:hypothetical protein [Morganella morganii]UFH67499.1 hypothetical protein KQH80_14260 [Morganella morganii]WNP31696.1 hypothetical protein RN616_05605 [Morganella morganii]HEI9871588.1 hypothetical protein [Morganella morganii]